MKNLENICKIASFGFYINCGSMLDDNLCGISHFLEHIIFSTIKEEAFFRETGTIINANTTRETMSFTCICIEMYFNEVLRIFKEKILHLVIDKVLFEREVNVVLSEIRFNQYSKKNQLPYLLLKHSFGEDFVKPICGFEETVKSFTIEDVNSFYHNVFLKCRRVLSSSNVVDGNDLFLEVDVPFRTALYHYKQTDERTNKFECDSKIGQCQFCRAYTIPYELTQKERIKYELISILLGGGMGSDFYNEAREMSYCLTCQTSMYSRMGILYFYSLIAVEDLGKVKDICSKILLDRKELGITEKEFTRIKNQYRIKLGSILENPTNYMDYQGRNYLVYGNSNVLREQRKILDSITIDDILDGILSLANYSFFDLVF